MNLEKFKGVFVALNTIYDENDEINIEEIKKLVKVYESKGVKGVYVCGSTGEGFLLSTDERMKVAEAVKEAKIREAEGEAEAILAVQKANAKAIELINEAAPSDAVIAIKSLEAFAKAADGKATKIIIPSEIQSLAGLAASLKELVTEPVAEGKNDSFEDKTE